MDKKIDFSENCEDPECVLCQDDDGDAAFWDEFLHACEESDDHEKLAFTGQIPALNDETGKKSAANIWNLSEDLPVILD